MIKIISGQFRGRKLSYLKSDDIRPTQAKVRKSIMDSIRNFDDKKVLDLFSGVGSLCIEALSRVAKEVHFVDNNNKAINILKKAHDDGLSLEQSFDYSLLDSKEEILLTKSLLIFPDLIKKASYSMEPQSIANYLMDIASDFHHYYAKHKVITDKIE